MDPKQTNLILESAALIFGDQSIPKPTPYFNNLKGEKWYKKGLRDRVREHERLTRLKHGIFNPGYTDPMEDHKHTFKTLEE